MRIALGIEYDGTSYNGWQRQENGIGVQQRVEEALAHVADESVDAVCAGRTDTGVHAAGQVVHFDTRAMRSERGWLLGTNTNLPPDIAVCWVRRVSADFHARFSATGRRYRYLILNRLQRSALQRHRAWWVHQPLDERLMHEAAQQLVGEHDFSAFRAAGCQARSARRTVTEIAVSRHGNRLEVEVAANAFLMHMVRNITGTLVAIGQGERPVGWMREVLESRDRTVGGVTAPPHGLTPIAVDYPEAFGIPTAAGC